MYCLSVWSGVGLGVNGWKYVRLFWTLVVIAGFTCAALLINQSFNAWNENPIKTTVETLPISEITIPKVTVCPPKNTYTDLNYDLMMARNMTMNNDTKNELVNNVKDALYDSYSQYMINKYNMFEHSNTSYDNAKEKLYDT